MKLLRVGHVESSPVAMHRSLTETLRSKYEAAFTLTEVIVATVVVGIMIVFAAAGIPGLMAASRKSACVANLKQIGVGLKLYVAEHNGTLPRTAWGSTSAATDGKTNYKWMDAIFPYVRDARLFVCPEDAGASYRPATELAPGETSTAYGSYGLNGAYRNPGDSQTPPRSGPAEVRFSQIEDPSGTVWVADTANRQEANGSFGFTWANAASAPSISAGVAGLRQLDKIIERHQGHTNVLFCDGRVASVKLEVLAERRNVRDRVTGATVVVMPVFTLERE